MAPDQPGLWDESPRNYGESELEAEIRTAIEKIDAVTPLSIPQRAIARVCRALAANIESGNRKGRAIANEASQLTTLMYQLAGVDPTAPVTESTVDNEIKELLDAFAAPAPTGVPDTARRDDST